MGTRIKCKFLLDGKPTDRNLWCEGRKFVDEVPFRN